jgi:hypothetical protein
MCIPPEVSFQQDIINRIQAFVPRLDGKTLFAKKNKARRALLIILSAVCTIISSAFWQ